ncbi:MAG: hypothetical protein MZV63_04385 [Marinilabiliales bacterium]|nr:hypothetical protein [Marinilabiliales bacterium]
MIIFPESCPATPHSDFGRQLMDHVLNDLFIDSTIIYDSSAATITGDEGLMPQYRYLSEWVYPKDETL